MLANSGVPQGSVLGPVHFIIFINDIVDCVKHSTIRLFADDTLLYLPISSTHVTSMLQSDLNSLFHWCKSNDIKFNAAKSNLISLSDINFFHVATSLVELI